MNKLVFKIISRQVAKKKGLKRYFTGKPCVRNHLSERGVTGKNCLECAKIHEKKYLQSKKGKEKKRLKQQKYVSRNLETVRERDRVRSKTTKYKERTKIYNQRPYVQKKKRKYNLDYREKNLEKLLRKDREYSKIRRKNPLYKIKENLRRRILLALKDQNAKKTTSMDKLIGCTIPKFKKHIADQFYPNTENGMLMTWSNHGLKTWHIDHIKPLKLYDLTKIAEQKKAFNYRNCSPKWAKENLSKGARFIG
jgi:hypothetical protein